MYRLVVLEKAISFQLLKFWAGSAGTSAEKNHRVSAWQLLGRRGRGWKDPT